MSLTRDNHFSRLGKTLLLPEYSIELFKNEYLANNPFYVSKFRRHFNMKHVFTWELNIE